jgi:hypothetical protein
MRRIITLCSAVAFVVACGGGEQKPADTTTPAAAAPAPPPAPTPISLADVAGKWNVTVTNEAGDSTLTSYVLTATADTAGWTITFPDRKPIPVHVMASGDSLIFDAGPYASVLRKGVQVTTHGVSRIKDGKLVGSSIARYNVKTADSVRTVKQEGTKAP